MCVRAQEAIAGLLGDSQVSDLSRLLVLRKYCGFSMTGILVIPMMTASAFMSEDDGVLEPFDT